MVQLKSVHRPGLPQGQHAHTLEHTHDAPHPQEQKRQQALEDKIMREKEREERARQQEKVGHVLPCSHGRALLGWWGGVSWLQHCSLFVLMGHPYPTVRATGAQAA